MDKLQKPEKPLKLKIVRSSEKYAPSYCATFDEVAREGKFLSISSGYSLSDILAFIQGCRECGYPQFLLLDPCGRAVGWCDIVRRADTPVDVGYLGVGILKPYRGMGWGARLMTAAIEDAKKRGFREIRLEVRASNYNAIRTYTRLGFVKIAYTDNGVVTDGVPEDVWTMSLMARRLDHSRFDGRQFLERFPRPRYKFHPSSDGGETT